MSEDVAPLTRLTDLYDLFEPLPALATRGAYPVVVLANDCGQLDLPGYGRNNALGRWLGCRRITWTRVRS
jgi:hypothetical protein